jgi:lysophospholipase L1-like esterase
MTRRIFLALFAALSFSASASETVLCYGDSITFGRMPEKGLNETNNWVELLGSGPGAPKTVNEGKNGRRTDDMAGLQAALKKTPDATRVILLLGTNDLGKDAVTDKSTQNMKAMIGEVRKTLPKAKILLVSPTDVVPAKLGDWWKVNRGVGEQTPGHVKALEAYLRALAAQEKVDFLSLRGVVPSEHSVDGIHPDPEGHRLIAEAIRSAFEILTKS